MVFHLLIDSNDGNDDQHHEADQTDDVDKQVHHQAEWLKYKLTGKLNFPFLLNNPWHQEPVSGLEWCDLRRLSCIEWSCPLFDSHPHITDSKHLVHSANKQSPIDCLVQDAHIILGAKYIFHLHSSELRRLKYWWLQHSFRALQVSDLHKTKNLDPMRGN